MNVPDGSCPGSPGCAVHCRLKGPSGSSRLSRVSCISTGEDDRSTSEVSNGWVYFEWLWWLILYLVGCTSSIFILVHPGSWFLVGSHGDCSKTNAGSGKRLARQGVSPTSAASKATSSRGNHGSAACTCGYGPRAAAVAGEAGTEEAAVLAAVLDSAAALFL